MDMDNLFFFFSSSSSFLTAYWLHYPDVRNNQTIEGVRQRFHQINRTGNMITVHISRSERFLASDTRNMQIKTCSLFQREDFSRTENSHKALFHWRIDPLCID